jgi:hypothetical protein
LTPTDPVTTHWRSKKTAAVALIALILAGTGATRYVLSRYRDERMRREMHEKARVLKIEIDRRFPVGTLRAEFRAFAAKQPGWLAEAGDDYYLSIGQEPSRVWYCGPWEVGVIARFNADRLASTEISTWGLNCP